MTEQMDTAIQVGIRSLSDTDEMILQMPEVQQGVLAVKDGILYLRTCVIVLFFLRNIAKRVKRHGIIIVFRYNLKGIGANLLGYYLGNDLCISFLDYADLILLSCPRKIYYNRFAACSRGFNGFTAAGFFF